MIDLDGVLADVRHRLHHLQRRPKNWQAFFAAAPQDPPLEDGFFVLRELAKTYEIVYLSGRPESERRATERWLAEHGAPPGRVLLRRHGDRRPARVTKVEALRRIADRKPVAVLVDDDPAVCAAVEAAGFTVHRADWGREDPADGGPGDRAASGSERDAATLFDAQEHDGRT